MRSLWRAAVAAALALASLAANAANSYPVVLVHGFLGWGTGEMFGLRYWGGGFSGSGDLQAVLQNPAAYGYSGYSGATTYIAQVGPVSSNWDRAIELFYQIKGGCVDYGPYHSANIAQIDANGQATGGLASHVRKLDGGVNGDGSLRPRRCWYATTDANYRAGDGTPLYPQWGNDSTKKIHLIGHSQGGQTARMLLQLLRNGSPSDVAADPALGNETLQKNPFTGGKNWIASVSSVATPHDGTSLAEAVKLLLPEAQQLVGLAAATAGVNNSDTVVYDFMLEQYGLARTPGESFSSYIARISSSSIWTGLKDISAWDLGLNGAAELNTRIANFSDVYYFSFATQSSFQGLPLPGWQFPQITTTTPFQAQSALLGCYTRNIAFSTGCVNETNGYKLPVDSSWWPNDSWVNTRSMTAPTAGFASPWVTYSGTPQIGKWNYMGVSSGWDHLDIVGLFSDKTASAVNTRYLDQVKRLQALGN